MENQKPSFIPPWEAGLVIVVTFFVFLLVSIALLATVGEAPTLVIGELLILIVPFIYLITKKVDIKSYIKLDLNPKYILIGVGLSVLLLFLNIAVSEGLTMIFGQSQAVNDSNAKIIELSASPTGFAAVAASLALAGVCEEFAFRGLLQNSIFKSLAGAKSQTFAFTVAAVVSALVFGVFHFDPQYVYIIAAFITGLALGAIYHKWNYTTSAVAHASMNLIVLALLLMLPA